MATRPGRTHRIETAWTPVLGPRLARRAARAKRFEPAAAVFGVLALTSAAVWVARPPQADTLDINLAFILVPLVAVVAALSPRWSLERQMKRAVEAEGRAAHRRPPLTTYAAYDRWLAKNGFDSETVRSWLEHVDEASSETSPGSSLT